MSAISFSGLVTGLDTDSWVSALTALKNAKIEELEEEKTGIVALRDVVSNIKSYFTSFRSALERITDAKFGTESMDLFVQNLANSSDPSKVTASATPSASRDSYEVEGKHGCASDGNGNEYGSGNDETERIGSRRGICKYKRA